MIIKTEINITSFGFWGNAKYNANGLTFAQIYEVERILDDLYPDGIDETQLNDLFAYDFDTIKEWLGIEGEEC